MASAGPRHSLRAKVAFAALCASTLSAFGAPSENEVVERLIAARWAIDKGLPFKDVELAFSVGIDHVPPPEEIARLRARVEGRPDHPDRASLRMIDDRLAAKMDSTVVLRWFDETHYRLDEAFPGSESSIAAARVGEEAWQLADEEGVRYSMDGPRPAAEAMRLHGGALGDVRLLVGQALDRSGIQGPSPRIDCVVEGDRWSAEVYRGEAPISNIQGRIDEDGRLLVDRIQRFEAEPPRTPGNLYVLSGHVLIPDGSQYMAGRVDLRDPGYEHSKTVRLRSIQAIENAATVRAQVLAMPEKSVDSARAATLDLRGASAAEVQALGMTVVVPQSGNSVRVVRPGEPLPSDSIWPRVVAMAGALTVCGALFWWLRALRSRPKSRSEQGGHHS